MGLNPFPLTVESGAWTCSVFPTSLRYVLALEKGRNSSKRHPSEIKYPAIRQVLKRGHKVAEAIERFVDSSHTLRQWVNAAQPDEAKACCAELVEARSEILKQRSKTPTTPMKLFGEVSGRRRQGSRQFLMSR